MMTFVFTDSRPRTLRGIVAARMMTAILIWLAVAFSLGWYYTFTYYGRTGIPMPTLEPCAALVLYYFSVANVRTEIQAVHWMAVFPLAGVMWAVALHYSARALRLNAPRIDVLAIGLACAALPIAVPGPWMAWIAGSTEAGFNFATMLLVALRREEQAPWTWLNPFYLAIGVTSLVLQLIVYQRLFRLPLRQAVKHYPASAVLLSLSASVLGAILSVPMRLLE